MLHVCIPTQACDNFQVINILFSPFLLILQVISDNCSGLLFKNKRDRKIINVDPKVMEWQTVPVFLLDWLIDY